MRYPSRTNQELLEEISALKQRIKQLEQLESKLKQSEKALQESEERYVSLVDNIDFGINLIGKDFKIITTNVVSGRLFNKPASKLLGKYCFKEFEKRQTVCEHCPGVLAMATGQAHQVDTEGILDDGSRFLARIHAFPLFYPDGSIKGFIEVIEDITERKQMEAALKESERRLADIIDFLPDATLAIDLSGNVIAWNRAMEEMTGVKAEDMLGKSNHEYAIPFYGRRRPILIDLIFESDEEIEKNYDFVKREGDVLLTETCMAVGAHPRVLWGKARPLYNSNGNVIGAIESVRDITELRQAKEDLQKAHDELEIRVKERTSQLEALNAELESFSYSVSHDLRAPLRAIDGFSRMILKKQGAKFNEDTLNKFNVIRHNTETMGKLIDGLLELSRLDRRDMIMSIIDMDNLIREIWEEIEVINPGRKMSLTVNPAPQGFGDIQLIRQVYSNLLSNAVKFTKNRDVALIETGGFTDDEKGNIYYVKDNGAGFDMAYYKKLFGVFQRLHGTEEFEGTGIGLATIQRIINKHGGRVWAEGKVDKGATFYFSLPALQTQKINKSADKLR